MESTTRGPVNKGLVACSAGVSSMGLFVSAAGDVGNASRGIAHMSERAWRKRMQQSAVWIAWILCELLSVQDTPSWLETDKQRASRILWIDATRLSVPAGTGDDVRLHWSYDLLSGRTQQVAISDRHQAEGLGWFKLRAGDITVTDAGYPVGSTEETRAQPAC
jgi:hypothetical protein